MIGWMALRSIRKATRSSKKDSKPSEPAPSWGEITKDRSGQWAVVIFAGLFIGGVVLIMWFIDYANTRY